MHSLNQANVMLVSSLKCKSSSLSNFQSYDTINLYELERRVSKIIMTSSLTSLAKKQNKQNKAFSLFEKWPIKISWSNELILIKLQCYKLRIAFKISLYTCCIFILFDCIWVKMPFLIKSHIFCCFFALRPGIQKIKKINK